MAGHIAYRVRMRTKEELQNLDDAYSRIPATRPVTRKVCIGTECSLFDMENGLCKPNSTPVTPDESICVQTEGPRRVETR